MIKWITDRLGTASWEQLKQQQDFHVVDVRDMVDRAGNPSVLVQEKIQEALSHLALDKPVVIACDYGMSRSNALAAGVLAQWDHLPFREAVNRVMSGTGEKELNVDVLAAVREAVTIPICSDERHFSSCRKRILITGGTGLIGTQLIAELSSRHAVTAPTRHELDLVEDAVDLDLLMAEEGITCVVHLANPRIYTNNRAMGSSLAMLRNVIDACRKNSVKLVYSSDWEVYSGYRSQGLLAAESLPRLPKGPYGETKMLCELLIEHHHGSYGLEYAIVRSSPVYGGGDKPKFIYNFLNKALAGDELWTHRYLNGFPKLDLLHVSDYVAALAAVIEGDVTGPVNVGSGNSISTTELAELIIALAKSGSTVKHRSIEDWAPNIVMDTTFARSTLRWVPKTDIEIGISKLVENMIAYNL